MSFLYVVGRGAFRMRIRVEFVGQLREATGCGQTIVDIEKDSSLLDLVRALAKSYGAKFEERVFVIGTANEIVEDLSILLNGRVIPRDKASSTELNDNDTVVLMPEVII
jgi:molybdopterin converting factor small subunit